MPNFASNNAGQRVESLCPGPPFRIYEGDAISATLSESDGSFCDIAAASRYKLNLPVNASLFRFAATIANKTTPAYCLEKGAAGPKGLPYQSASFESLFPSLSSKQKYAVSWLLANTYPVISSDETFALAGIDPAITPPLDDNDAYAAVQAALWWVLGQITPAQTVFLDCSTGQPHPKSERLQAAVRKLTQLSLACTNERALSPGLSASPPSFSGPNLQCCGRGTLPGTPFEPYLLFDGCPDELRVASGRLLIGPFLLRSNLTELPIFSFDPVCACDKRFSALFVDYSGRPIDMPVVGQEFYLALRSPQRTLCFQITATIASHATQAFFMRDISGETRHHQHTGAAALQVPFRVSATLCICAEAPLPNDRCTPPCPCCYMLVPCAPPQRPSPAPCTCTPCRRKRMR